MEKVQSKKKDTMMITILSNVFAGSLMGLVVKEQASFYETIIRPPLSPPGFLFPIVWTILYALMGVSLYMILKSDSQKKRSAVIIFAIQLALNLSWSFIFFTLRQFLLAFFWIIALWVAIFMMIRAFTEIDKKAAYLQIPYLLWVTFAGYLTLAIYLLNR